MPSKMGKDLPKMGKNLHRRDRAGGSDVDYAGAIAAALRQELGLTHQAIKSAMRWTGASERTVKYWFAGTSCPNGKHLIALARHSDSILGLFLQLTGRQHYAGAHRLVNAHDALRDVVKAIQSIIDCAEV